MSKSKNKKKPIIIGEDYIKIQRKLNREIELERNGGRWIAVNRTHKSKKISKAFKFIAPAGAIICAVLLWVGVFTNATIGGICALWATVYGLGAGTIDANIIIDIPCSIGNKAQLTMFFRKTHYKLIRCLVILNMKH